MNIFVGNIAFTASEDDLRELFEQHGVVDKVHLITDRYTGRSRGFGSWKCRTTRRPKPLSMPSIALSSIIVRSRSTKPAHANRVVMGVVTIERQTLPCSTIWRGGKGSVRGQGRVSSLQA